MKRWKQRKWRIIRTALALGALGVIIPAQALAMRADPPKSNESAQPSTISTRPDDRAGVRGVGQSAVSVDARHQALLTRDAAARAERIRGEGLNKLYADYARLTPPSSNVIQRHAALGQLYSLDTITHSAVRPDDRGGFRGVDSSPIVVTAPSGFDWNDAGIGAAGALGVSFLLVGLMLLALRTQQRRHDRVALS